MNYTGGGAPEKKLLKAIALADDTSQSAVFVNLQKCAFTLAEVLITLGIIGIIAAMTLPTVINRAQEKELEARFRKVYNTLNVATQKTVADLEYTPFCYAWAAGERPYKSVECIKKDDKGNCTYGYPDGSRVPSDYGGPNSDCNVFDVAFRKNLNIIKNCKHTEADGCTVHYKGKDTLMKENDESLTEKELNEATTGDAVQRESVLNAMPSYVLIDGTTIFNYSITGFHPFIDINGKKGPNKWGYDLYRFKRVGSLKRGIYYEPYVGHPVEKGGRTAQQMFETLFKK